MNLFSTDFLRSNMKVGLMSDPLPDEYPNISSFDLS